MVAALLIAITLLSSACSDAPTPKQIRNADDGVDPAVVTVLIPKDLERVVTELGTEFTKTTRGVTFTYIATDGPTDDRIVGNFRPSLWIDETSVIARRSDEAKVMGSPTPFGENPLLQVTAKTVADPPIPLDVFATSASPMRTALCADTERCGTAARAALDQQGIQPDPDVVLPDAKAVALALADGTVDTAILYRSDASRVATKIRYVPLPDPRAEQLDYQTLVFGFVPPAAEFQRWLASSPVADELLVKYGYRAPSTGRT